MNLGLFKTKREGAKKGYDLLKNKADALKVFINVCQTNFPKNIIVYKLFRFALEISVKAYTTPKLGWLINRLMPFSV